MLTRGISHLVVINFYLFLLLFLIFQLKYNIAPVLHYSNNPKEHIMDLCYSGERGHVKIYEYNQVLFSAYASVSCYDSMTDRAPVHNILVFPLLVHSPFEFEF